MVLSEQDIHRLDMEKGSVARTAVVVAVAILVMKRKTGNGSPHLVLIVRICIS